MAPTPLYLLRKLDFFVEFLRVPRSPRKPLYLLRKLDFAVVFWGVAEAETFIKTGSETSQVIVNNVTL